jgi:hypothetical protein
VRRVDAGAEGKRYPEVTIEVTLDRLRAFGAAVGGSGGIPPTFPTVAEFAVFPAIVADPDLALDYSRVVHGDQEYEHRRALRVGESLTVRSRIVAIRHKGGLGFLTIETELVGADGDVAAIGRSTMIERPDG